MSNKSFLELALEVIRESKEPLSFKDLFDKVVEKSGQTPSADERKRAMSDYIIDNKLTNETEELKELLGLNGFVGYR